VLPGRSPGDGSGRATRLIALVLAIPLAILSFAGFVSLVAVVDHRGKQASLESVEVANWECRHHGIDCGTESWEAVESRWQRRELTYRLAVVALSATAVGLLGGIYGRPARPGRRSGGILEVPE
jgi:hypothetical protein